MNVSLSPLPRNSRFALPPFPADPAVKGDTDAAVLVRATNGHNKKVSTQVETPALGRFNNDLMNIMKLEMDVLKRAVKVKKDRSKKSVGGEKA